MSGKLRWIGIYLLAFIAAGGITGALREFVSRFMLGSQPVAAAETAPEPPRSPAPAETARPAELPPPAAFERVYIYEPPQPAGPSSEPGSSLAATTAPPPIAGSIEVTGPDPAPVAEAVSAVSAPPTSAPASAPEPQVIPASFQTPPIVTEPPAAPVPVFSPPPPADLAVSPGSQPPSIPPPSLPAAPVPPPPAPNPPPPPPPVTSPWTFQMGLVEGRSRLDARNGKEAHFEVGCDKMDMQAPDGNVKARGKVTLMAEGFDASCEGLTINWTDEQVLLEGNVKLKCSQDGRDLELGGDRLTVKLVAKKASCQPVTSTAAPPAAPLIPPGTLD